MRYHMRSHLDLEWNSYITYHNGYNDKRMYTIVDKEKTTENTEEITEIDLLDLPPKIYIEENDIVWSATGESMDLGHTRSMSGMGESMSHGRTEDARQTNNGNPSARPNHDLSINWAYE